MDKPLLILDLDETLVYSTTKALGHPCDFQVVPFFVYRRPFLSEFLEIVSAAFILAVWTSSTLEYAESVVSEVFSESQLEFLWARERCTRRYDLEFREHYWIKDLKKVRRAGYNLNRVLFVDNTSRKLERNYGNRVVVHDFEGDLEDMELPALAKYLISIVPEPDFRAIEKRGWRTGT